jgi:Phosphotransferase enzyme family
LRLLSRVKRWSRSRAVGKRLGDLESPSLSQLEIASCPELMQDVFRRHLRSLNGKACQIRECQLCRTSFKKGGDRHIQYTLRLADPRTGIERTQWVVVTMHAGRRSREIWEKLRRSESKQETPYTSSAFTPFSYIPQLEMLMQAFPYDHRLPSLPLLMAGPPSEVEPLLLSRFGPGDWQIEAWDIEPVRYLPELKATLRYTARARDRATNQVEERRFYAKIYNDEEGEQTHLVLQALWDKTSAGGMGFIVGKPIAYLSDLRALFQEETPGTSLRSILLQEEDATPVIRKAARALAPLHLGQMDTPRRHSLRKTVIALERSGNFLRRGCPSLKARIETIVDTVATGLEEIPLAPAHRDLRPEHILFDGNRFGLLDLDKFAEADPVLDVANLLARFVAMPFLTELPHDRARIAAWTFAEEYFAHVPEAWHNRLPLHYAGALLQIADYFFRRQIPGLPDKIEALIEEAEGSLVGKVW